MLLTVVNLASLHGVRLVARRGETDLRAKFQKRTLDRVVTVRDLRRKAVFDEKRYTMDEVLDAIRCDFEGHEPMRQYLINRIPKWGNNDPEADALARRVADYFCSKVHTFTNARGGPVQAALFTITKQWDMGKITGATPDGRKWASM